MTAMMLIAVSGAGLCGLLAWGLLVPREMNVSRSAVVRGPLHQVEEMVSLLPRRCQWISWTETEPEARYDFEGEPGELGSTMAWDGSTIGRATLTLTERVHGSHTQARLDYHAPIRMTTTDRFDFEDLGDGTTRVTWTNKGKVPAGMARVFALVADRVLGPDYERGLERLDEQLASRA